MVEVPFGGLCSSRDRIVWKNSRINKTMQQMHSTSGDDLGKGVVHLKSLGEQAPPAYLQHAKSLLNYGPCLEEGTGPLRRSCHSSSWPGPGYPMNVLRNLTFPLHCASSLYGWDEFLLRYSWYSWSFLLEVFQEESISFLESNAALVWTWHPHT
ncbi:hypothetical protein COCON_G00207420 [Conger conger]|uniref:Uncharacterized protein n=1 Tax=Conger conger TaxID=82655 RepID=A0A9Q1CZM2_CONCO|nr:hypothetical protein COCON_G00207420 [Conger conger]